MLNDFESNEEAIFEEKEGNYKIRTKLPRHLLIKFICEATKAIPESSIIKSYEMCGIRPYNVP